MLLLKSWHCCLLNCSLLDWNQCNLLPPVLHLDQLEAAPAFMSMNKLTRCYWNLTWKCYSQDSRLTSSKLRKPFNSTGIQTLGRWEQVGLDGIVCCLSNCYTPLCSKRLLYLWGLHWVRRGKKKSCLPGVKQFSSEAKSCVRAGLNPHLV